MTITTYFTHFSATYPIQFPKITVSSLIFCPISPLYNIFHGFPYLATLFFATNQTPVAITLSYRIIMQQILLIFFKIPICTPLFHPARLLILGNFEPKPYFALVKNEKFQPVRPYSILNDYSVG